MQNSRLIDAAIEGGVQIPTASRIISPEVMRSTQDGGIAKACGLQDLDSADLEQVIRAVTTGVPPSNAELVARVAALTTEQIRGMRAIVNEPQQSFDRKFDEISPYPHGGETRPSRSELLGATTIFADDVYQYFVQLDSGLRLEDLGRVIPPLENMLVEFTDPHYPGVASFGALLEHVATDHPDALQVSHIKTTEPIAYYARMRTLAKMPGRPVVGPLSDSIYAIQADGRMARTPDGQAFIANLLPAAISKQRVVFDRKSGLEERTTRIRNTALLAVSFMHCRNHVSLEPREAPTPRNKKEARRMTPIQGIERHHTLKIDPIRQWLDANGARNGEGAVERALHLYRGHFKRYTEAAPLFGKNVGEFFWMPGTRGSAKKGVVTKDYAVGTPGGSPGSTADGSLA